MPVINIFWEDIGMVQIDLGGMWHLKDENGQELCNVEVPGSVVSGLYSAGLIEHPYYRENEYIVREMFHKDYEFERVFEISKEQLEEEHIELICEGLDTLTEIYINDKLVAKTDNMHRTYKLDVKDELKEGTNQIRILFKSVLNYIDEYQYEENKTVHYIPSGGMKGNHLLRKAHSMLGWDWGPQLVDAGIWRNIYLLGRSTPQIEDVRIHQKHFEDGSVEVKVAVTMSEETDKNITVTFCENSDEKQESNIFNQMVAEKVAENKYVATIKVTNPKLWWPNGYGEQPLYDVCVNTEGAKEVKKTIGLRTLTISQEKDQWGKEFAFIVNGVKIFTMGGNYIPEDAVYPWIKKENIEFLLKSCVRANFNCVRIWGGGYYPSDYFYDLCDRYGLIVWQDLMYACNVYDLTKDFGETIRQEALDNVKRLRHHASLGLWCGNNEIESAWDHWGDFQIESMHLRADYVKMFEHILPNAVNEEDDITFYWPSSPSSGGCFDNPDSENQGDTHYWDVWHGQKPFSDYQKYYFRFCSEFGFQSFPCMKTINTFAKKEDQNIFSRVMESHQKNDSANGKMLYYLSENFKYPKDFKSLLYITQVLQGMAIKSGVEHWRRNRGRCMGTLYWQINDNWPVASWASIDYYGRWKALHYMAKKFYSPVAASICHENNQWSVHLENETMEEKHCTVFLRLRDMNLNKVEEWKKEAKVKAQSAGELISVEMPEEYIKSVGHFLEAEVVLSDGETLIETETLAPYKHMELIKPQLEAEVKEFDAYYEITVKSRAFAPFVEMDFEDADVIFSDNFFTISSDKPVKIILDKSDIRNGSFKDAEDLKERLILTTVADTF